MNVRIFSVCAMECIYAQTRLGLYSHPKELWGNGVRNHVNSKGEIPSTGGSEEVRTHDTASCTTASPTHYQLSYCSPLSCHPRRHRSVCKGPQTLHPVSRESHQSCSCLLGWTQIVPNLGGWMTAAFCLHSSFPYVTNVTTIDDTK